MCARQARQRAPSHAHETSGRLSYQAIGVAQRGQREPGRTIDSSAGSRWMHTFRKLPMQAPTVKTSAKSGQSAAAAAGSSIPEMTWVTTAILRGGTGQTRHTKTDGGRTAGPSPADRADERVSYDTVRFGEPAAGALFQV